jgi:hypothetical protein
MNNCESLFNATAVITEMPSAVLVLQNVDFYGSKKWQSSTRIPA